MPIYEFECQECNTVFEKMRSITDERRNATCTCGGPANKIISKNDFRLKGGGWEADGYMSKVDKFKNNMKAVDTY